MAKIITESGMQFGPFEHEQLLPIETCASYKTIQHGIPIAEFLLSRPTDKNPNAVWIVEAKTSMSRPENKSDFTTNIQDICHKFINSVHLFLSGLLARNTQMQNEVPSGMSHITATNVDFKLILVTKKSKPDWLIPIQDALRKKLSPLIKTLSLNPNCLFVFNEDIARQKRLIV